MTSVTAVLTVRSYTAVDRPIRVELSYRMAPPPTIGLGLCQRPGRSRYNPTILSMISHRVGILKALARASRLPQAAIEEFAHKATLPQDLSHPPTRSDALKISKTTCALLHQVVIILIPNSDGDRSFGR